MATIRIASVADIHSPRNLSLFKQALASLKGDLDLFMLAGDVIYKGRVEEMVNVVNALREKFRGPLISVFGNEEFKECEKALKEDYGGHVAWLDDESLILEIKGKKLGIVGTRGSLSRPTKWQLKNIPNITDIYAKRVGKIDSLLSNLACDFTILISHYAVTFKTLKGENPYAWLEMGSKDVEDVINRRQPTIAIHGHAHNSKVQETEIGKTKIFNVSLPATKEVKVFELPPPAKKPASQCTLTKFLF